MKPKKETMQRLSKRLTRRNFPCEIETQGDEHIIRCGRDVRQPDGIIVEAGVIPFQRQGKDMLRVSVALGSERGMQALLDTKTVDAGMNKFEQTTKPKFEKKGFAVRAQKRPGYNFPVQIYGEIEKPSREPFSTEFEDSVSDFVNEAVGNWRRDTERRKPSPTTWR